MEVDPEKNQYFYFREGHYRPHRQGRLPQVGVEGPFLLKKVVQQNLGTQGPQVHRNLSIHVSILTFMVPLLPNQLPNFNRREF